MSTHISIAIAIYQDYNFLLCARQKNIIIMTSEIFNNSKIMEPGTDVEVMDDTIANTTKQFGPEDGIELDNHPLSQQLDNYLKDFYARMVTKGEFDVKPSLESIRRQGLHIIDINNRVSEMHDSERYQDQKERHKRQRGRCAIGMCQCIDGRNSIPHGIDQVGSVWETKAGILKLEDSPFGDGIKTLESSRLEESIAERAQNSEKGPLLEVLFAHTSLHNPDHGCGAMKQRLANGVVPEGTTDLVLENLRLHEESAKVIDGIYNRNVSDESKKLAKVAIAGVQDTDTMGYVFGYETDAPLRTTTLAAELEDALTEGLTNKYGVKIPAGTFRKNFNEIETFLDQSDFIYEGNEVLLKNDHFLDSVNSFLDKTHPELVEDQRQAFRYMVARNVSFQHLTGLYKEAGHPNHPFSDHEEDYQAVSLDGITMGQYDPEHQVFGASPANAEEAIDHITTQCALMDSIGKAEKPYMLFLSRTVPGILASNGMLENERGILRKTFTIILKDQVINKRIRSGELALVPVLLDKTRRTVQIPNFAK